MLLLLVVFFPLVICMSRWLDDFPTHSIVKSAAQLADRASKLRVRSKRAQGNEKVKELREQKEKKKAKLDKSREMTSETEQ